MADYSASDRASVSSDGSASRYLLRSLCRGTESHMETPEKHRERRSGVAHGCCDHDHHGNGHEHGLEHLQATITEISEIELANAMQFNHNFNSRIQSQSEEEHIEASANSESRSRSSNAQLQSRNSSRALRSSGARNERSDRRLTTTSTTEISRSSSMASSLNMTHQKCCTDERFDIEPKTDYTYAHTAAYRSASDRLHVPEPNLCRPRLGASLHGRTTMVDSVEIDTNEHSHVADSSSWQLHLADCDSSGSAVANRDHNAAHNHDDLMSTTTTTTRVMRERFALDEGYQPAANRNGRSSQQQSEANSDGAVRRSTRLTKKQVELALAADRGLNHESQKSNDEFNSYQVSPKSISTRRTTVQSRSVFYYAYDWLTSATQAISRTFFTIMTLLWSPFRVIAEEFSRLFGSKQSSGVLTGFDSDNVSTTTAQFGLMRRNRKRSAACCWWFVPATVATVLLLALALAPHGSDADHAELSLLQRLGNRVRSGLFGLGALLPAGSDSAWHRQDAVLPAGGSAPCCNCDRDVRNQVGALRDELLRQFESRIDEKLAIAIAAGQSAKESDLAAISADLQKSVDELVNKRVSRLGDELRAENKAHFDQLSNANIAREKELEALRERLASDWNVWQTETYNKLIARFADVNASLEDDAKRRAAALNESLALLIADRLTEVATQLDGQCADLRTQATESSARQGAQDAADLRSRYEQLESAMKGQFDGLKSQIDALEQRSASVDAQDGERQAESAWQQARDEMNKFEEALNAADKQRSATLDERLASFQHAFDTWTATQSAAIAAANTAPDTDSIAELRAALAALEKLLRERLADFEALVSQSDAGLQRELAATGDRLDAIAAKQSSLEKTIAELKDREQQAAEESSRLERAKKDQASKLSDRLNALEAGSRDGLSAVQNEFAKEFDAIKSQMRSLSEKKDAEPESRVDEAALAAHRKQLEAQLADRVASLKDNMEKRIAEVLGTTGTLQGRVDELKAEQDQLDSRVGESKQAQDSLALLVAENGKCCQRQGVGLQLDDTTTEYLRLLVLRIVAHELELFKNDQTNRTDYALESSGGSVVSTGCTKLYQHDTGVFTLFGMPIWYRDNSPRRVIAGNPVKPGECWSFAGATGELYVQLSRAVHVTAITYEHLPRALSPDLTLASAPRELAAFAFETDAFNKVEPIPLGNFTFDEYGSSLQTFATARTSRPVRFVQLRVLSNFGRKEFTCLYRVRVHGDLPAAN